MESTVSEMGALGINSEEEIFLPPRQSWGNIEILALCKLETAEFERDQVGKT